VQADTDGDSEISLDEWLTAAKAGHPTILLLLDPGTVEAGAQKLDDTLKISEMNRMMKEQTNQMLSNPGAMMNMAFAAEKAKFQTATERPMNSFFG